MENNKCLKAPTRIGTNRTEIGWFFVGMNFGGTPFDKATYFLDLLVRNSQQPSMPPDQCELIHQSWEQQRQHFCSNIHVNPLKVGEPIPQNQVFSIQSVPFGVF